MNIDNDPEIDIIRRKQETFKLHRAIQQDDFKEAEKCLKNGADIEGFTLDFKTPLIHAAHVNALESMRVLIHHGCNIDAKNTFGYSALHIASFANVSDNRAIDLLLENYANIESKSKNGSTPLIVAARWDNEDSVRHLIECGANPLAINHENETALSLAKQWNNIEMVSFLEHEIANLENSSNYITTRYAQIAKSMSVPMIITLPLKKPSLLRHLIFNGQGINLLNRLSTSEQQEFMHNIHVRNERLDRHNLLIIPHQKDCMCRVRS